MTCQKLINVAADHNEAITCLNQRQRTWTNRGEARHQFSPITVADARLETIDFLHPHLEALALIPASVASASCFNHNYALAEKVSIKLGSGDDFPLRLGSLPSSSILIFLFSLSSSRQNPSLLLHLLRCPCRLCFVDVGHFLLDHRPHASQVRAPREHHRH
jgi:hypothetical protein